MVENGRPGCGLDSLQLSGCFHVKSLKKVVEEREGGQKEEEEGGAVADDYEYLQHGEHRHCELANCLWQSVVRGFDVFGEPVENSSAGHGVEERHRTSQHVVKHQVVKLQGCFHENDTEDKSVAEDESGLKESRHCIYDGVFVLLA